jgi:hypothetical protein
MFWLAWVSFSVNGWKGVPAVPFVVAVCEAPNPPPNPPDVLFVDPNPPVVALFVAPNPVFVAVLPNPVVLLLVVLPKIEPPVLLLVEPNPVVAGRAAPKSPKQSQFSKDMRAFLGDHEVVLTTSV